MRISDYPTVTRSILVQVGNKSFQVTLEDNAAAKSFAAQLPLTLMMKELNNNEKFAQLPKGVPTQASIPARIEAGDLMMFGSATLVLFYKGFNTSYSYTQIGKIENIDGLTAALGNGDVNVRFELPAD